MNEQTLNCNYHPKRQANAKCEKCGKLICLECKMVYHQSHSSGSDDDYDVYYTRHEFCTPCYYDQRIKAKKLSFLAFTVASIMTTLMIFFFGIGSGYFIIPITIIALLIGLILLVIGILYRIKIIPKKLAIWEKKKEEFFEALSGSKSSQAPLIKKSCSLCGKEIQEDEEICENCGTKIES
ncbi:MAG: B-box zinc finger protein [Promethearchaeota archaeon]